MAFNDPAVVADQYEDEALPFRVTGRSTIFVATR